MVDEWHGTFRSAPMGCIDGCHDGAQGGTNPSGGGVHAAWMSH